MDPILEKIRSYRMSIPEEKVFTNQGTFSHIAHRPLVYRIDGHSFFAIENPPGGFRNTLRYQTISIVGDELKFTASEVGFVVEPKHAYNYLQTRVLQVFRCVKNGGFSIFLTQGDDDRPGYEVYLLHFRFISSSQVLRLDSIVHCTAESAAGSADELLQNAEWEQVSCIEVTV